MAASNVAKGRVFWFMSASAVGLAFLVLIGAIWDWNWFRPLVERRISEQLNRSVKIGHFDIKDLISRDPLIVLQSITVGNPLDFPNGTRLGTIDRLGVRVDVWTLLRSHGTEVILPEIAIERPNGDLRPGPSGNPNWVFGLPASSSPRIGRLTISDGNFRIADPKLKADFKIAVHTEAAKGGGEDRLVATIRGTYDNQPITAEFTGGARLSLRDANKPYPVDLKLENGATHIRLKGVVRDPLNFAGADLQLELEGKNLADLYDLIGIPLAPTPPFHLAGHLDYTNNQIRFRKFAGTVGQSDLEGEFDVARAGRKRPLVTAALTSRNVVLADLAGFIGSTPGKAGAPNDTQGQKALRAAHAAKSKLIPDIPIDFPKLQLADFKVTYFARQIQGNSTPFDNLRAKLTIEDGKISLLPLSFGIGESAISGNIHLDPAQGRRVHGTADIDFRDIDLRPILHKLTDFKGAGLVDGAAHITGTGNSLSQMLANGDGDLSVTMTGGDVSALVMDLAGLDLGRSMLSWLGLADRAPLRCMAGDFALAQGMLRTRDLLFDTTEANLTGKGGINLRDETLAIEITSRPKHASVGRLPLPIEVSGTLKNPTIRPGLRIMDEDGPVATLLSLLTIQLGVGKDNDCRTVLSGAVPASSPTSAPSPLPRAAAQRAAQPHASTANR